MLKKGPREQRPNDERGHVNTSRQSAQNGVASGQNQSKGSGGRTCLLHDLQTLLAAVLVHVGAGHLLEQLQALGVLGHRQRLDLLNWVTKWKANQQ